MNLVKSRIFLLVASAPKSIMLFRGDLIKCIIECGYTVHVAAPNIDVALQARLREIGVISHNIFLSRVGLNPITDLRTIRELFSLIRRLNPSFVLSYTIKPVIYASLAARLAGVANIYSMITGLGFAFQRDDSNVTLKHNILRSAIPFLYKISLAGTQKVFFQNVDDRDLFLKNRIVVDENKAVITNGSGVNTVFFAPRIKPYSARVRFLFLGRLLKNKGIREYASAAQEIIARGYAATFTVAGLFDDNPDSISHGDLKNWTDSGCIRYLGSLDDVRDAIQNCDVYVLPSYREGTPRSVLEAMAMGKPIITTDAPGCRETVLEGETGFLIPPRSHLALVVAMERFIRSPHLIESMGVQSRKYALDRYDVDKVNAGILRELNL